MTVPPYAGRLAARLSLVASAVLLGALCVHAWTVLRAAPPAPMPRTASPLAPAGEAGDPAALHLFGRGAGDVAPVQAPPANLVLLGVIAAIGARPAVALLTVDGKPQALRPGDEISAGATLREVQRDRVVIDQNGVRSELLLPNAHAAAAPAGLPAGGVVPIPPGLRGSPGAGAPASAFHLEVQSVGPNHMAFSKSELSRSLQDPHAAAALGRATPAPGGGLSLDEVPPGSLPDRIGLRSGDVLRLANGQPLNNLTDLPRLYQEFGNAGEVRLEIARGGQPAILQYTMRP